MTRALLGDVDEQAPFERRGGRAGALLDRRVHHEVRVRPELTQAGAPGRIAQRDELVRWVEPRELDPGLGVREERGELLERESGLRPLTASNGVDLDTALELGLHELERTVAVGRSHAEVVPRHDRARDLGEPHEQRTVVVVQAVALARRIDRQQAGSGAAHRLGQCAGLGVVGEERRDVLAELTALVRRLAAADAGRARVERGFHEPHHLGDLVFGGGAFERSFAHHVAPHCAVAHLGHDVEPDAAFQPVEVVGEGLPTERRVGLQRRLRYLFCGREQPHEVVLIIGSDGGQGVPAVAHEDGRDAVNRRRIRGRVPEELCVVVRMRVDEPGRDDLAVDRDRALCSPVTSPTATMRPSVIATSPAYALAPVPSTMRPPLTTTS